MVPLNSRKIFYIALNSLVTVIIFAIGYFRVHYIYAPFRGTDYLIYSSIYSLDFQQWYAPGSLYYYSPLFYVLFVPFLWMGMDAYFVLGYCFYFIGLILCIYRVHPLLWIPICLNLGFQFWVYFSYGNMDLYLFGILVSLFLYYSDRFEKPLNKREETVIGFIFGLCTFKGTVIYLLPIYFFLSRYKKTFIAAVSIGIGLNFGALLFDPSVLFVFLQHITLSDHPDTNMYLLGLHYPWLWATVGLLIQFFNDRNWRPLKERAGKM
jgi:hypothetical protein